MAGRFRDPLIGKHLLIGVLFGVVSTVLFQLRVATDGFQGQEEMLPAQFFLPALLGTQRSIWGMRLTLDNSIFASFFILFLLLAFTLVLRQRWLATEALYGFFLVLHPELGELPLVFLIATLTVNGILVFLLIRYGLLVIIVWFVTGTLTQWPMTTDSSAWYFGTGLSALGVILMIASYGLYISLGRTPVLSPR